MKLKHPKKAIQRPAIAKKKSTKALLLQVKDAYKAAEATKGVAAKARAFLNYADTYYSTLQTSEYLNALYMACITLLDSPSLKQDESASLIHTLIKIGDAYLDESAKNQTLEAIKIYADQHHQKWGDASPFYVHTGVACAKHNPTSAWDEHPESSARLGALLENVSSLFKYIGDYTEHNNISDKDARKLIIGTHGQNHLNALERHFKIAEQYKESPQDSDNIIDPGSKDAIFTCATIANKAMSLAVKHKPVQSHYCVIRPPGHHAGDRRNGNIMQGFCFINNAMIAANTALNQGKSVLIIDIDAHSGNGTADMIDKLPNGKQNKIQLIDIFSNEKTDFSEQISTAELNNKKWYHRHALNPNFSITRYKKVLKDSLNTVKKDMSFKPDVIIVSAGFDAHKADSRIVGGKLTSEDFGEIGSIIHAFAKEHTIPAVALTEGGYTLDALAESSFNFALGLSGQFNKKILEQETVYETLCTATMSVAESSKPAPTGAKPKRR